MYLLMMNYLVSYIYLLSLGCFQVTDKSLQFISTLGKLQVLSMVGCYFVTDEGLRCLNNGNNSLKVSIFGVYENFPGFVIFP